MTQSTTRRAALAAALATLRWREGRAAKNRDQPLCIATFEGQGVVGCPGGPAGYLFYRYALDVRYFGRRIAISDGYSRGLCIQMRSPHIMLPEVTRSLQADCRRMIQEQTGITWKLKLLRVRWFNFIEVPDEPGSDQPQYRQ